MFCTLFIYFDVYVDYSNSFGILMHCLDDPVEKLLVFRLAGEGPCGSEAKAGVVHQLARLLADSIFSTNTVRTYIHVYTYVYIQYMVFSLFRNSS